MGFQTQASSMAEGGKLGATLLKGTGAGNYTTSSASYVAVDSSNLLGNFIVPRGFSLLLAAAGLWSASVASTVGIAVTDGATILQELLFAPAAATTLAQYSLSFAILGDNAGHAPQIQWKTSAGTATMANSSTTHLPTLLVELTQSNF
jgi:hypothetical protein